MGPLAQGSSVVRFFVRVGSACPFRQRRIFDLPSVEYRRSMARITVNPNVMGGVPCLRGLRIPVATVVNMVAGGMTVQEIVAELPPLEPDDVAAALRFAADAVSDREIDLQATA